MKDLGDPGQDRQRLRGAAQLDDIDERTARPLKLNRVTSEGWVRAYLDGGQIIRSCLGDGLVADIILTRIPLLLGGGIPLFGTLPRGVALRHIETKDFPSGLVQTRYEVIG